MRCFNVCTRHRKTRPEIRYQTPFFNDIQDGNSTSFIVRHWFKRSRIPEQIRNRTIPTHVRNGLNYLSNNKEHGLLGGPTTEWDGRNIQWLSTLYFKASFPVRMPMLVVMLCLSEASALCPKVFRWRVLLQPIGWRSPCNLLTLVETSND